MLQKIKTSYEHTIYASYIGYITQAIVNNFAPLLFLTFASSYYLTLDKIAMITTVNFTVQLIVDFLSAKVIDKLGYRPMIVAAHVFAASGLIGMAILPEIMGNAYAGILVAVVLYAVGGGIIEVLISPIVEACPTKKKEAAMSLLHSFYCWGHVGVVLVSTLFFTLFGVENWRVLACIWAIVPIINMFYFMIVPIYPIVQEHEKMALGAMLKQKVFWILMILMVCAGASEQAMSQWASAFAESALHVSKTVGDLMGPLKKMMAGCALLCIACYLMAILAPSPIWGLAGCAICGFSVGIFWPGTFSLAAAKLPGAGTAMYAFMALAGDVGCSSDPTLVGIVANQFDGDLQKGLIGGILFPVLILAGIYRIFTKKSHG